MPTYHARNVKLSLVTSSLSTTTIAEPKRVRGDASAAAEQVSAILRDGEAMKETVIQCPDDQRNLWYLGEGEDVPFYLVRVGQQDLFKPNATLNTASTRPRRHRNSGGTLIPEHGSRVSSNQSIVSDDSKPSTTDSSTFLSIRYFFKVASRIGAY